MQPIAQGAAAGIMVWTIGAAWLSVGALLAVSGISLDLSSAGYLAGVFAFLLPFLAYTHWRRMIVLPTVFGCLTAVFASIVPILVWSYAAMRLNMPLADAGLAAMDAALGFDWFAFIAFVDARPLLAKLLADAYSSFYLQLLLLPILLALFRREQRAYAMVFAYYLLCLASSVISIWYPALGTYVVYGVGPDDVVNINAKFGFFFLDQFHAVREAGPFTLALDESAGILTFPSVHAGVATLCVWAAWDVRLLRYPVLALNLAMATAAISHANHYLVDVIAGIGIAGLCVSVATLVFYRQAEQRSPLLAVVSRRASSPAAASG